jgi:hypothetical protein
MTRFREDIEMALSDAAKGRLLVAGRAAGLTLWGIACTSLMLVALGLV